MKLTREQRLKAERLARRAAKRLREDLEDRLFEEQGGIEAALSSTQQLRRGSYFDLAMAVLLKELGTALIKEAGETR